MRGGGHVPCRYIEFIFLAWVHSPSAAVSFHPRGLRGDLPAGDHLLPLAAVRPKCRAVPRAILVEEDEPVGGDRIDDPLSARDHRWKVVPTLADLPARPMERPLASAVPCVIPVEEHCPLPGDRVDDAA